MPYAINKYEANGSTTNFVVSFPYLSEGDLIVSVSGVVQTLNTDYTIPSASTVVFNSPPANNAIVEFRRNTSQTTRLVDYTPGSIFKESDLDTDGLQTFYMSQEAIDIANDCISVSSNNTIDCDGLVVTNVADPVTDFDVVTKGYLDIVAPDVATVASLGSEINDLAGKATAIGICASINYHISQVANNETAVTGVFNDISNVNTVAGMGSDITAVLANQTDINAVANDIADINTVAADSSAINSVISMSSDITALIGNATNINTVATNIADVNTVAGDTAAINTVNNMASDITNVVGNASNINAVAGNASNINAVASDSLAIVNVSSKLNEVNTVHSNIADINTVASNITDVNSFADTYSINSTAPSSPTTGDLWYDTISSVMKVYNGSSWGPATSIVAEGSARLVYTVGTPTGGYTGSVTEFPVAYDIGYVDVFLNGVKLVAGTDFTATNGTLVTLTNAAVTGDTVDLVAYGSQSLTDVSDVASNISDISTVASSISNVDAVAPAITNINSVANNLTDIVNASYPAASTVTMKDDIFVYTASSVNSQWQVVGTAGNYYGFLELSANSKITRQVTGLTVGKRYSLLITGYSNHVLKAGVGTSSFGYQYGSSETYRERWLDFTATQTSAYITLENTSSTTTYRMDNINLYNMDIPSGHTVKAVYHHPFSTGYGQFLGPQTRGALSHNFTTGTASNGVDRYLEPNAFYTGNYFGIRMQKDIPLAIFTEKV